MCSIYMLRKVIFDYCRYQKYIERIVYSNLQQAQLGGVPGVFFLVKSFLKIRPLVAISHELEVGYLSAVFMVRFSSINWLTTT